MRGWRWCGPCRRRQRVRHPLEDDLSLPSNDLALPNVFQLFSHDSPAALATESTSATESAASGTESPPSPSPMLPPTPKTFFATPKKIFTSTAPTPKTTAPKATPQKSAPTAKGKPKPAWRRSPWSRNKTPKQAPVPPLVLSMTEIAHLAATAATREELVQAFVRATRAIRGHSTLVDYFLALGRCEAPSIKAVQLDDLQLQEFRTWLPPRQAAAIRLLAHNPFVTSVSLNGCHLEDSAGEVLAELVQTSKSLTSLSVERNDLREAGLLAIVDALRGNAVLTELRINHQRFTVTTPVEEALHEMLHHNVNTTLCKLGLVIRNDVPRSRINAALMRNVDAQRLVRRAATRRCDGEAAKCDMADCAPRGGLKAVGLAALMTGGAGPRKRQLPGPLASFAAGLEAVLAPFDVDGLIAHLQAGRAPEVTDKGVPMINLNNDVKFAKCSAAQKVAVVQALASGSVQIVELANANLGDQAAMAMADVLRAPHQQITSVNLEGNLIGSSGIAAIAAALPHAPHLCELRLDHQVGAVCSNMAEMALAQAVDAHPTLHKISYTMRQIYARDITQRATMRNRDKSRLQRLQMRKMQKLQEQAQGPLRQFV